MSLLETDSDSPRKVSLDDLDLALISLLQQDGRASLTHLGSALNVSHGTARNRLERLLKEGIIRVIAVVAPEMVGFTTQVLIGIRADLGQALKIEQSLAAFEEVNWASTLTGAMDFLVGGVFRSDAALRQFLLHKLPKIHGIKSIETNHILQLSKRVWHWRIPVDLGDGERSGG